MRQRWETFPGTSGEKITPQGKGIASKEMVSQSWLVASTVVDLTGGSWVFNPGVCSDGFRLDRRQIPQIQHHRVFNVLMRFLSSLLLWIRDGTKRKRRKKEAHDVNLFASCNNNPVIPPRKCLFCLMPLYAIFSFMVPKSLLVCLFIYRFLLLGRKMRGRKWGAENAIPIFKFNFIMIYFVAWLGVVWFPREVGKSQVLKSQLCCCRDPLEQVPTAPKQFHFLQQKNVGVVTSIPPLHQPILQLHPQMPPKSQAENCM